LPGRLVRNAELEKLAPARGHDLGRLRDNVDLDAPPGYRSLETVTGSYHELAADGHG
jgi:hypothetical protein